MKTMRGALAILVLGVLVVSSIGCQAMPVTMSPFASYGGNGIDYSGGRNDPNHQWQVGVAASFVLGGNGAVANAVPAPALPSQVRVNGGSSSATNSNNNTNTNTNTNSATFVPPGQQ